MYHHLTCRVTTSLNSRIIRYTTDAFVISPRKLKIDGAHVFQRTQAQESRNPQNEERKLLYGPERRIIPRWTTTSTFFPAQALQKIKHHSPTHN